MNDSGQDFVALCSKLLKRVRKKPGEPRQPRKAEHQSSSQPSEGDKRRKCNKKHDESGSKVTGTQPVSVGAQERLVTGGTGHDPGDAGSSAAGQKSERGLLAKDKVLQRMQQFKRASPQRMVQDKNHTAINCVPLPQGQIQESSESFSSGLHPEPQDSDEALAFRLQQELDREAAEAQMVDLEDGGLFFCQICHKDLSHMTPEGRTQHINRCLDESEESFPAPPPPLCVPDCPICGKKFKSQKSRSSHLKRCSTDMGISPAVLLQALQRQAEERKNVPTAHTFGQTGGTKRKGPCKPGHPARKKSRKKTDPLDEDTMVALALSSSLLEQEREQQKEGKGRGKKKKGGMPRPPALLLVQDSQTALMRLQERVSALLLRSFSPVPPTPTRCPSTLPGWTGAAPLWQKSSLIDRGSSSQSDFYTPELRQFITPWESAKTDAASSNNSNKPESSLQRVSEGNAVTETTASTLPSTSHTCASCSTTPSTLGTRQLPVGNQALQDLMELAEEGMTLTQCYTASGPDKDKQSSANLSTNLHLSGFVLEETEEQFDLCVSGFLPETAQAHSENPHSHARRKTDQSGADIERGSHRSVALSRLASDLSSMVNNPQLSDVQLQVDSGDVYFAHSFMVYARCPLLAEMVYESGFGVQEEGMPSAQRVLMSDVPGQAVFTLLQYLYTAHCSIPASLQPHVLELASRFDLQELQQLCEQQREEADYTSQENGVNNQTDQAFMELLRSMWNAEDEGDEEMDIYRARDDERVLEDDQLGNNNLTSGDREICEEKVNEEELKEIYEFAATQRKKEDEDDGKEEKIYEEDDEEDVFTNLSESKGGSSEKSLKLKSELEPDLSLDCSYSSLFSESWSIREDKDPSSIPFTSDLSKAHPALSQQPQSSHKPPAELSCRTLLQSSASVVNDFSLCPPSSTSNLPIPGVSPGQVGGGEGTDTVELDECQPLKQESQGPHSICIPLSPDLPQNKKTEPELIVLSDSSEEMEVVLSSCSPSPRSPCAVQNPQSYTQIKSQQIPKPNEPTCENKESSSLELSLGDPVDCSPEVSWLIPSTPVQPERHTRTSSTQTKSSMCRTQLFPKNDSSSPFSVFSSPALSSNRHKTFKSPTRISAHIGPTEGSVSSVKLDRIVPSSSSLDLNFSPKENNIYDVSKHREPKVSHLSSSTESHPLRACSKQETPVHLQPQPYSSTPMHAEFNQPPGHLAASPLHTDPNKKTFRVRERAPSESPENTELGSFQLSTPADLSDPPSSSSCRGLQSLQRHSSSESRHCVESRGHNNSGSELKKRVRVEGMGVRNESAQDLDNEGEQDEVKEESGEVEIAEYSFQQSFMDEPPIAFNDSWGLDACVEENPGCFSLRLEDSRGSSQQERSLGQGETARSTSSTNCQAPPSPHCIQSLKTHGSMINTSPSEGHSTQTLTCVQAHTSPPFTLPQRDHTTRTTPEFNSLLDSKIWDSWEEEEQEVALPLSQRVNPSIQLKTPTLSRNKKRCSLVPITPMPHYSDMDTPELKNKLNRFGVRPLPKRQMILKLKEIHQYTHQLVSSDSEDEAPFAGHTAQMKPPATSTASAYSRPISCTQPAKFKEPRVPAAISPVKPSGEVEGEPLSSSQGSNTSTAASEESERSNPELCPYSDGDSDSDGGISSSQVADRLQDRLRAVHTFILSDPTLYSQILHYQPVVLSQLQERLRAAGIRLGAAKLVDYLDSQCITFTTAKPGKSAPSRRCGKRIGKAAGKRVSKKKGVTAII